MSMSFVGYDAYEVGGTRKSVADTEGTDKSVCRQLDELERISQTERDKHLGRDYFNDIKQFYNLEDSDANVPSFRPQVKIPQLQTLVLNEAVDITDSSPKIYIVKNDDRDEEREKFFQANWRQGCYNNRLLEAFVWAMLSNLGYLQVGFNPSARRGVGSTWVEMRDPSSVYPDPFCKSDSDWAWLQWEDWMYIDEVHRLWPDRGRYVRPHMHLSDSDPWGSTEGNLEFPEASPLSQQGTQARKIFRDNRVRVRHTFLFDNTREKVENYAGSAAESKLLVHPRFQYKYPDGRWITDCEDVVLADGNNWCPQLPDDERGTFPLVRVAAMPTITNFWGPPPIKLSRPLQNLSERLYTQLFENIVRTNNGVIVLRSNSGLDPQAIGWLPGEVLMINPGSEPPQVISPQPLPQHMITVPASLLALQKELQGYTQARQGNPGAGNISVDLFDATMYASQAMTRLRARMLAESIQRLAQMVFYVQGRYSQITDKRFLGLEQNRPTFASWNPIQTMDDYDAYLDEGSLRVLSGTALKSVISALGQAGLVPTGTMLENLDIPDAQKMADERNRELELQALGKLRKPR